MFDVSTYLGRAARAWPQQPALCENERCVATFAELDARVQDLAAYLVDSLGLRSGDRVALFAENRARYVEVMLALWRAHLTVTPVNARLHPAELAYILGDSGARLCLTTSDRLPAVATAIAAAGLGQGQLQLGDLDADPETWTSPGAGSASPDADPAIAWLFYTSGTTGKPKGVMITHENLRQAALNYLVNVDSIRPGDSIVHLGPLSHGTGIYVIPHLACGAVNIVARGIEPSVENLAKLAGGYGPASVFMAPTMIARMLAKHDVSISLEGIRTIVFGGGPMHVEPLKKAFAVFGKRLVQIYGQGESPMTITCLSREEIAAAVKRQDDQRLRTVGRPFCGAEVEIRDDANNSLPAGSVGELCVRGPTVMRGYWRQPDATREAICDGWLRTGDVGAMDAQGFITLLDRSKDVIISGGMNIYSTEVEDALLNHADVAEVAIVGAADAEWGEKVVACIVAADGRHPCVEQLDQHCLQRLARFKRPKEYRFLDELPKNNYGKVIKRELKTLIDGKTDKPR